MAYIYGIIKEEGKATLSKVLFRIDYLQNISISELCKFHNYATALDDQYSSCLPPTTEERILNRSVRCDAVNFEHASQQFMNKYGERVIAMSHRKGGWHGINWKFNDDISFQISTNFGFGMSSYFYSTFKYKDIVLAPYSFYIKYKNSTFASVLRCTYEYTLNYSNWDSVMTDCIEFYNAIVFKDNNYVLTWIDDQLSQMVSGLEKLLYSSSDNFYDCSINSSHASGYATIRGEDFWIVKSKKIAFSLDFIDNIKSLPVEINPTKYVKRISSICDKFRPLLDQKIKDTQNTLKQQEDELDKLKKSGDYELYSKLYSKYYFKRKLYLASNFRIAYFFMHLNAKIRPYIGCSEIRLRIKKLKLLLDNISKQQSKVRETSFLLGQLNESKERMLKYFNSEITECFVDPVV